MRLLLASALVALLVVVWLPSSGLRRARAVGPEATVLPSVEAERGEGDPSAGAPAATIKEEKGPGEEGEIYRITVVSSRDGAPIAGATATEGKDLVLGVTGADGVAEIRGRGYRIIVSAPGYFSNSFWPGSDRERVLILSPGALVAGKVVDLATRRPIVDARITVRAEDADGFGSASTDADGAFEVSGALWHPYTLTARAEGYTPAQIDGTLTGPVRDVEVALAAGGTLEGTVWSSDGSPAIAHVELRTGKKRIPLLLANTDKQGNYRITGVPLGVEVTPWTQANFAGDPVVFRAASEVLRRDIRYPARVQLIVSATGPLGEAIEPSQATLTNDRRSVVGRPPDWLQAPPGDYRLKVWADGWPSQERDIVLTTGGGHEMFVFEKGLAVTGTVVGTDGEPVEGAYVSGFGGSAFTDAQGRFEIRGLSASPVGLDVSVPWDYADTSVEGVVPGGPPIVVKVPRAAEIVGRVVGGGAEVQYCLWRGGGPWAQGGWGRRPLEADGRFWFLVTDLSAAARLALRRDLHAPPVVFSLPPLEPGEVRDLGEIRFPAGRTVALRVLDDGRKPVACAAIAVAEHWAEKGAPHVARADGAGRLEFLWMPETPFWVRVDADGWPPHFFRVYANAVDLSLSRGGVVEGPSAMRIRPAKVHESARNGVIQARRDPDGRYRARLQPGEYVEEDLGAFVVGEGETTELKPQ